MNFTSVFILKTIQAARRRLPYNNRVIYTVGDAVCWFFNEVTLKQGVLLKEIRRIAIIMGSASDFNTMQHAEKTLKYFKVPYDTCVVSAHRTPKRMYEFASTAAQKGYLCIIAGAGGAAHLPGMVASLTSLPVLGVPIQSRALSGIDSLLSIVQMPAGVPTATFAIGAAGAINAALFSVRLLALQMPSLQSQLNAYMKKETQAFSTAAKARKRKTKPA